MANKELYKIKFGVTLFQGIKSLEIDEIIIRAGNSTKTIEVYRCAVQPKQLQIVGDILKGHLNDYSIWDIRRYESVCDLLRPMADMATASHEYLRALNIVFDTLKRVNDLIFTAERAEIAESIQIAKQTIALDYFDEVLRFGPSLPIEDEENPDPLSYHDSEAETELETHRGDSRP